MMGFYERHREQLYAYLVRLSGDPFLADDLFQEAFLRYLRHYGGQPPSAALLYTIARNAFIDHTRRRTRLVNTADEQVDGNCDQEETFLIREEYRAVVRAMQELEAQERDLLALVISGELSYRQIAAMTGLSEANVKVRVHRARLRLRRILEG